MKHLGVAMVLNQIYITAFGAYIVFAAALFASIVAQYIDITLYYVWIWGTLIDIAVTVSLQY